MYLRTAIEGDFDDRTQGSLNNCLYLPARARPTGDDDAFQCPPEHRRTLVKQIAGTKPSSPGVGAGSRADPPRLDCHQHAMWGPNGGAELAIGAPVCEPNVSECRSSRNFIGRQ